MDEVARKCTMNVLSNGASTSVTQFQKSQK